MNDQYNELKKNPLFSSLNLSEAEFNEFLPYIEQMLNKNTKDEYVPNLIRIRNQVVVQYIKNPYITDDIKIKNNYIYLDKNVFDDQDFELRLEAKFFEKSKKDLSNAIKAFLNFKDNKKDHGCYVWGGCGLGKTRLTIALANELALMGKKIGFVSSYRFSKIVRSNIDEQVGNNKTDELIEKLQNVDVLFIDDLGGEYVPNKSWFYSEILFNIFDYRMNKKKPTFFTSNLSLMMFKTQKLMPVMKFDKTSQDRFIERIKALVNNEIIEVSGVSKRY